MSTMPPGLNGIVFTMKALRISSVSSPLDAGRRRVLVLVLIRTELENLKRNLIPFRGPLRRWKAGELLPHRLGDAAHSAVRICVAIGGVNDAPRFQPGLRMVIDEHGKVRGIDPFQRHLMVEID